MQCTIRQRRHLEKLDGTSGGVDTNAHPFPPPSNQIYLLKTRHIQMQQVVKAVDEQGQQGSKEHLQ